MGRPKRAAAAAAEKAIKGDEPAPTKGSKKVKSGLAVGDDLPSFELQTDTEATLSSTEMVKDSGIVLFAYPKANTGGCTTQAVGLSEKAEELAAAGYKLYGISADKPQSQTNWKKKASITCTLLCDPSYEVLEQLGFRKGPKSINRSHIVVAKGGKILDVQYGISPKASIKDAVEFCLTNKGEAVAAGEEAEQAAGDEAEQAAGDAEQTAAAEQAEEAAAAAPEEPKAEELKAEDETAPEPEGGAADAVADGDAADETAPADDAAAMEVDAAAEVEEPKEAEEEKAADAPAAVDSEKPAAVDSKAAADEDEAKASEPAAAAAAAAAEEPAAAGPAAAGDVVADEDEAAAAEADKPVAEEKTVAADDGVKDAHVDAPASAEATAAAE